jgi:hypothetical protein
MKIEISASSLKEMMGQCWDAGSQNVPDACFMDEASFEKWLQDYAARNPEKGITLLPEPK